MFIHVTQASSTAIKIDQKNQICLIIRKHKLHSVSRCTVIQTYILKCLWLNYT